MAGTASVAFFRPRACYAAALKKSKQVRPRFDKGRIVSVSTRRNIKRNLAIGGIAA